MSQLANISALRTDYRKAALDEASVGQHPIPFFEKWFLEACAAEVAEANAMTLATASKEGIPHARMVLLKGVENNGFTFFTNYDSNKGHDLQENPHAALVFYWKELERQVRIEGRIERLSDAASDEYFHSRPEGSRLGAWASPQSKIIPNRDVLEANYNKYQQQFAGHIPRPSHWGGFVLLPSCIEFWQGRSNRMHDRVVFINESGAWKKHRLAP